MTLSGHKYKCKAGETFDSVALTVYGDEQYACELLSANPLNCRTMVFTGGEELELPVVEIPEKTRGTNMPAKAPWKE